VDGWEDGEVDGRHSVELMVALRAARKAGWTVE